MIPTPFRWHVNLNRFFVILLIISALGLALRFAACWELFKHYPPVTSPSVHTDMYTYRSLALAFLAGDYDISKGFYYQPFYYSVFLPLVYGIGGYGPIPLLVTQSAIGAGVIWLTGISFARIFGKCAGLAAALFIALNRSHIFYTAFTLIAVLQSFWLCLLLYTTLLAYEKKRVPWWLGVGLVNGVSIVTRGNSLCFIPLILGTIVVSLRKQKGLMWICALVYLGAALLPQLPYSIVNYKNEQHWVGASTAAPAVLALGNTPESPPGGREPGTGAGPME